MGKRDAPDRRRVSTDIDLLKGAPSTPRGEIRGPRDDRTYAGRETHRISGETRATSDSQNRRKSRDGEDRPRGGESGRRDSGSTDRPPHTGFPVNPNGKSLLTPHPPLNWDSVRERAGERRGDGPGRKESPFRTRRLQQSVEVSTTGSVTTRRHTHRVSGETGRERGPPGRGRRFGALHGRESYREKRREGRPCRIGRSGAVERDGDASECRWFYASACLTVQ